jgi:hypothetical protein
MRAELPGDPLAAHQAVAMLARERALVLAHQAPLLRQWRASFRAVAPQVEDGPHVQRADRGVGVPGAARAVRAKTSVRLLVYSARCSSGTAQSSMKDTGLPSPRMLIMMFRPALRTSHSAFCSPASPFRPRCPAARGRPSAPPAAPAARCSSRFAGEFHQQDGVRARRSGLFRSPGGRPDCRAPVRSWCGRPVPPRPGPSLTMWRVMSIAWWKVGKLMTPSDLVLRQRRQLQRELAVNRPACLRCPPAGAPG